MHAREQGARSKNMNEVKLLATEWKAIEKICCQIGYASGESKLFTLDVADWFAVQCLLADAASRAKDRPPGNAVAATNGVSEFFALVYLSRLLAKQAERSSWTAMRVFSLESLKTDLYLDWLHAHGVMKCARHGAIFIRRYTKKSWNAVPHERLNRLACALWQSMKRHLANFGVLQSEDVIEIRLGLFKHGQRRYVFNNAEVQSTVDDEDASAWVEGMYRLKHGLEIFLKHDVPSISDWKPRTELLTN
jgi:hypothetical protein